MAAIIKQKTLRQTPRRGQLPTKRTINLATVGQTPINWLVAAPAILAILLAAGLVGKFAVADRYIALSNAQARAGDQQAQVEQAKARMDSYGALVDEYAHYTYSGMTEDELALVDRVEVMDMLERVVMPQVTVTGWTMAGNQLTLPMTGDSLEKINGVVQLLQAEPIVDFCTVSTAATNQYTMQDDVVTGGGVTAQVTVYLVKATAEEASGK